MRGLRLKLGPLVIGVGLVACNGILGIGGDYHRAASAGASGGGKAGAGVGGGAGGQGVGGSGNASGASNGASSATGGSGGDVARGGTGGGGDAGASEGGAGDVSPTGGTSAGPGGTGQGGTDGGTGGTGGGSSGMGGGGTAGQGGGTGGSGGTSGSGGTTNAGAGSGGAGAPPTTGCARIRVPIDSAFDKARAVISFATPQDFSSAIITARVYAEADVPLGGVGPAGCFTLYVSDNPDAHEFHHSSFLATVSQIKDAWKTLTWNVGTEPVSDSNIDKTRINRIILELSGNGDNVWGNPTTVYVDSVIVTTPAYSFTFDGAPTVSQTPMSADVASNILWLNSDPAQTTEPASTLAWVESCP